MISHHISKGETIAQSLKDRLDYGKNPDKTQGGELISAYECDHMTADTEFLLAKAKYKAATGREQRRDADVLCYQIRQSFKPGEITPEEANKVGYETAMRWTKGKYALFSSPPIQTASTSTTTSTTTLFPWTIPASTATSWVPASPCAVCRTGCAWSMICLSSKIPSSTARASIFTTVNGWARIDGPLKKNSSVPLSTPF